MTPGEAGCYAAAEDNRAEQEMQANIAEIEVLQAQGWRYVDRSSQAFSTRGDTERAMNQAEQAIGVIVATPGRRSCTYYPLLTETGKWYIARFVQGSR